MEGRELVAFCAALIAAVLAIAKLIADKESRISDFRKDWINSFRAALAEMLGEAYAISGRITIRIRHAQAAKRLQPGLRPTLSDAASEETIGQSHTAAVGSSFDDGILPAVDAIGPGLLTDAEVEKLEVELTSHWNTLRKAHRTVLLHLNFGETVWGGYPAQQSITAEDKAKLAWGRLARSSPLGMGLAVTSIYDSGQNGKPSEAAALLVAEMDALVNNLLGKYYEVGNDDRYELIKTRIDSCTLLGNLVLKPEWNRIKDGEERYKGLLIFLIFFALAGALVLGRASYLSSTPKATVSEPSPSDASGSDLKEANAEE